MTIFLMPMFMGTMVTGMLLIRYIQASHMCRDMADMYIHQSDFSTYPMQQLAQRLASGLNLQIGGSFAGNNANNTSNGGSGIVTVSQIMYIGPTTAPSCAAIGASVCTNHDSFVLTQRIQFGNGTLLTQSPSSLGATSAVVSNAGIVQNIVTDSRAKLQEPAQTNMRNLWQVSTGGRTPLVDGQVSYVVETYFTASDLSLGSFTATGVYARYFF